MSDQICSRASGAPLLAALADLGVTPGGGGGGDLTSAAIITALATATDPLVLPAGLQVTGVDELGFTAQFIGEGDVLIWSPEYAGAGNLSVGDDFFEIDCRHAPAGVIQNALSDFITTSKSVQLWVASLYSAAALAMQINTDGSVDMPMMPTADPHAAGRLWNSSGVVHVSAG